MGPYGSEFADLPLLFDDHLIGDPDGLVDRQFVAGGVFVEIFQLSQQLLFLGLPVQGQSAPKAIEPRLGYMLPLLAQGKYSEVEVVARQVTCCERESRADIGQCSG